MFKNILNISLIFSCCFYVSVNCKCDVIHNYANGFPSTITTLAKNDYVGAMVSAFYRSYVATVKYYWPVSENNCKLRIFQAARIPIKYSLLPRGCCSYCCLIDRVEDDIFIYVEHKNKTSTKISLGDKKLRGKLASAGVDSKLQTIVPIHGFAEEGSSSITGKVLTQAIFRRNESYNVLRIDYSNLIPLPWIVEAMDNLKLIAKAVAKFLVFYHRTGELAIENMHIIGISLGAHLAGYIGKEVGKFKKVPRITGLDPAFALYPDTDKSQRLSDEDAEFVDIIHTDHGKFGFPISIGHADFYINYKNSEYRPGCNFFDLVDGGVMVAFFVCDHIRSILLYVETIEYPHSYPVVTTASNGTKSGYMGFLASKTTTIGDYYLTTFNNSERHYEHFLDRLE